MDSSLHPHKLKGKLLLASPTLDDDNFIRTVIMITDHSPQRGARGFIINRPSDHLIDSLSQNSEKKESEKLSGMEIYTGGPVEQKKLTLVAFMQRKKSLLYRTDISEEEALVHIQSSGTLVRAFAGYASWIPGQLENEFQNNAWISLPAEASLLALLHDHTLWYNLLKQASPMHALLSKAPMHAFLN